MRKAVVAAAMVLGMFIGLPALASDVHPNKDAQAILKQQQEIRIEMEKRGGRFAHVAADKRERVLAQQSTVNTLLAGKQSIDDLKEADRITVFNALEDIESILNSAEDDRMICERYKPVGSNRPKTVCMTAGERRAAREQAERDVSNRTQSCFKGANGGCL